MHSLKMVLRWSVKHARDELWLAVAILFFLCFWVKARELRQVEDWTTMVKDAKQEFRVYRQCNKADCKPDSVEVQYKMSDKYASVKFLFKEIPQDLDDVIHIFLKNNEGKSCTYLNEAQADAKSIPVNDNDVSLHVNPTDKMSRPYFVWVECQVRREVQKFNATNLGLFFSYHSMAPNADGAPVPSIRDKLSDVEPAKVADPPPPTKNADPPPQIKSDVALPTKSTLGRQTENSNRPEQNFRDFSHLSITANPSAVHGEHVTYGGDPKNTSLVLSPGEMLPVQWIDKDNQSAKELWLVVLGVLAAGGVAAFIEFLRPHIEWFRKWRHGTTI
jgi:hypothetical protein